MEEPSEIETWRSSQLTLERNLSSAFNGNTVTEQVIVITNEDGNEVYKDYKEEQFCDDNNNNDGERNLTEHCHSLRFHEAAIYMEEGLDFQVPHNPWTPNFLLVFMLHNRKILYWIDFIVSIVLFLLGFVEKPCHPGMEVEITVHCLVEIVCLLVKLFSIVLRTRWHWKNSLLKHKMDVMRCLVLVEMMIEVIVVLARQQSHFRITRAARPLFLFDNFYLRGIRRFLRIILETMPPILDILGLMMFFILIYSIFGFYLLGPGRSDSESTYFKSSTSSFINLFIMVTSANFPDVMMPSYSKNFYYSFFFVSYHVINVYFFMNLTVTVVYSTFTDMEEKTFKQMFMNKLKASQLAFDLLVSNNSEVSFKDFKHLMKIFKPYKTSIDVLLLFKYLNKKKSGGLKKEEFVSIYDALSYNWMVTNPPSESWYGQRVANVIIRHPAFKCIIYSSISLNAILMIIQADLLSDNNVLVISQILGAIFIILFCVEAAVKLIGLGLHGYFHSPWNLFDFLLTFIGVMEAILVGITQVETREVIWIRLLRFLRVLRIKKRFRDVFGTAAILVPQLFSVSIVMILIYYFFAIIGMELFSQYDLKNCCKNTSFEFYFEFHSGNRTTGNSEGLYYLNNFTNLQASSVTLFELTVVNNWHIIMEGYAWKSGGWSRIYFMLFYILTLVVLTIVIASILDAFLFRIQYKNVLTRQGDMGRMNVTVTLSAEELKTESKPGTFHHWFMAKCYRWSADCHLVSFTGKKRKTREDLQAILYEEDIIIWKKETFDVGTANINVRNESINMRKKRVLSMESSRSNCRSLNLSLPRDSNNTASNARGDEIKTQSNFLPHIRKSFQSLVKGSNNSFKLSRRSKSFTSFKTRSNGSFKHSPSKKLFQPFAKTSRSSFNLSPRSKSFQSCKIRSNSAYEISPSKKNFQWSVTRSISSFRDSPMLSTKYKTEKLDRTV